ncbi:unnamed protein product [Victoria cruziana]
MAQRQGALASFPTLLRCLRNSSPQKPFKPSSLPSLRRAFSLYDQINLIDRVNEEQLRFERFTDAGFTVNGVQYEGSLLCVGNVVLSWSPKKWSEVVPESLSVFQVLRPSTDIMVWGSLTIDTLPLGPYLAPRCRLGAKGRLAPKRA